MPVSFDKTKPYVFFRVRNNYTKREFDGAFHNLPAIDPSKSFTWIKTLYKINVKPKRKLTCTIHPNDIYHPGILQNEIKYKILERLRDAGFDLNKPFVMFDNERFITLEYIQYL